METMNPELYYDYHAKKDADHFRLHSDDAVKDLKRKLGHNLDIQVVIDEEEKNKGLFSVAMSISGTGEPIFVKKMGKNVVHLIKKVKKLLLKKTRSLQRKRFSKRRLREQKELLAS